MRMSGCRIATRVVLMALAACLFAAELANAGNINITATYSASISYYFDPPGSSFICSESESNSNPSAGGALFGITCTPPYDAPVPGMFVNTSYDAYSGGAEITGCDVRGGGPPIFLQTSCTAGVYLEGEYYFGGHGEESFSFGDFGLYGLSFYDTWLDIDGQRYYPSFGPLQIYLQLGGYHHVSMSIQSSTPEDGAFYYDFHANTPSEIGPFLDAPVPEPGMLVITGAGLLTLLLFRRRTASADLGARHK